MLTRKLSTEEFDLERLPEMISKLEEEFCGRIQVGSKANLVVMVSAFARSKGIQGLRSLSDEKVYVPVIKEVIPEGEEAMKFDRDYVKRLYQLDSGIIVPFAVSIELDRNKTNYKPRWGTRFFWSPYTGCIHFYHLP